MWEAGICAVLVVVVVRMKWGYKRQSQFEDKLSWPADADKSAGSTSTSSFLVFMELDGVSVFDFLFRKVLFVKLCLELTKIKIFLDLWFFWIPFGQVSKVFKFFYDFFFLLRNSFSLLCLNVAVQSWENSVIHLVIINSLFLFWTGSEDLPVRMQWDPFGSVPQASSQVETKGGGHGEHEI